MGTTAYLPDRSGRGTEGSRTHRSALAILAGAMLASALALVTMPARAQTEEPAAGPVSTVVPPGGDPLGVPYADWGAAWWQWLLNVPPVEDPEAGDCQVGQGGEVFFIPHVPPGTSFSVECRVGTDQWILASAGGTIWDASDGSVEEPGDLAALVEADIPVFSGPLVSIDGEEVADIESHWVTKPLFLVDYLEDNPLGLPAGTWRAAMGGWFVMVPPLEPGEHTIVVRDAIDIPDDDEGPLPAELTAKVTVEAGGDASSPAADGSPMPSLEEQSAEETE